MQSFFLCFLQYGVVSMACNDENNANIKTLIFFFNLFNTNSGCKVRKKLVTLRSKRRKNALRRKILNVSASDERSKAVKKVIFIKLLI